MPTLAQQAQINDALVRFVESIWSRECEAAMTAYYGAELTLKAKTLYDAAMDCPVDWYQNNMNEALGILANYLAAEFPWLSAEARTRLNYNFIMTWK